MLWHVEIFNMAVNGKILICAISWKCLIIEWNRWKFDTRSAMYCICSVLFMSNSLRSAWDHSVHFVKCLMLRFSTGYCSHSFHPIWAELYGKYSNQGGIQVITLFGGLPNWKRTCQLEYFVSAGSHGATNFNMILLHFSSDLCQTLWGHCLPWWNTDYYLSFCLKFFLPKILWHFESLTWEPMGKS